MKLSYVSFLFLGNSGFYCGSGLTEDYRSFRYRNIGQEAYFSFRRMIARRDDGKSQNVNVYEYQQHIRGVVEQVTYTIEGSTLYRADLTRFWGPRVPVLAGVFRPVTWIYLQSRDSAWQLRKVLYLRVLVTSYQRRGKVGRPFE